ncbi:MAG: AAA family ATPase [Candidatus Anammoxibacter sp.]
MSGNIKQHAKDYLQEFKAKKEWLTILIQKTINTDGVVSESDKNRIFDKLLEENKLNFDQESKQIEENEKVAINSAVEEKEEPDNQNLILHKISHKKGVNALIPDQSIPFSPTCTIIYGLNGTGKSGYFRIIHELAGGDQVKDILGNIYKQSESFEVDVEFLLNNQIQDIYEWRDKGKRGIYPFNQIKVFDSEYLPIFLDEKDSTVNIEPLGLNLFQIITGIIDEFKSKIDTLKQKEENRKPDLLPLIELTHLQELQQAFGKVDLTDEDKKLLEDCQTFSDKDSKMLGTLKQQKQDIEKLNTEDRRKVLAQEKLEINELEEHLSNLKNDLESLTKEISKVINDYIDKKKTRDGTKKEIEILKKIPAQNTDEWQKFIESAKDYAEKIGDLSLTKDETCIYCHQRLEKDAQKLVQAYSKYLSDQSQKNFKIIEDNIKELDKKLKNVITDFAFSENFTKTLKEIIKEPEDEKKNIKDLVDQLLSNAGQQKIALETFIKNIKSFSPKYILDVFVVEQEISNLSEQKQKALNALQHSKTDKTQKLNNLEKDIQKLEDKQNITKWKEKIGNYFSCCKKIKKYEVANQGIRTKRISDISSIAHEELLTDKIRKSFENELKALGRDIELTLKKTRADKGKVRTRLEILGNNVCDILSEGEQKAVGLALFLAELENQNDTSPVVFDDPVSSLDHEVRSKLAERIIKLSKNRQVIIFTHDLLFTSQLVKSGNDENIDFITHVIDRHASGIGRINENSSPKMANMTNLKGKYDKCLLDYDNLDFNHQEMAIASAFDYLRSACECMIEEVLFAGTIQRYDDHVKVQNLEEAVLDRELAQKIVLLHGKISEKAMMHNRSDFQSQGTVPIKNFSECTNEFEQLLSDIKAKRKENRKNREDNKKAQKDNFKKNW